MVVLQKSIPAQTRQPFLYIRNNKGYVDGFVGEVIFAKRLCQHFLWDNIGGDDDVTIALLQQVQI